MIKGLEYHQSKKELYHFIHRITRYGIKKLIRTKDYHKWKKKRKYGQRWMAKETAFSSIKRMFGEYTSLLSGFKLVKEMTMKVSL